MSCVTSDTARSVYCISPLLFSTSSRVHIFWNACSAACDALGALVYMSCSWARLSADDGALDAASAAARSPLKPSVTDTTRSCVRWRLSSTSRDRKETIMVAFMQGSRPRVTAE